MAFDSKRAVSFGNQGALPPDPPLFGELPRHHPVNLARKMCRSSHEHAGCRRYAVLSNLERLPSASSIIPASLKRKSWRYSHIPRHLFFPPSLLRTAGWGLCLLLPVSCTTYIPSLDRRFPTNKTPPVSSSEMDGTMRVSSSRAARNLWNVG